MPEFPALRPDRRRYNFGEFPIATESDEAGGSVRFLHGETSIRLIMELTYEGITREDATTLRDHYRDQQGSHVDFQLPDVIWAGHSSVDNIVPAGQHWRYGAEPEEDHVTGGTLVNVGITLVTAACPPPGDPYFGSVSILLPLDTVNGLADLSNNNFTMTVFGSAGITTSDPDFPDGALGLDGSTQYLRSPVDTALAMGTGPFTIECYMKADVVSGNDGIFTTGDEDSGAAIAVAAGNMTWSLIGAGDGEGGAISAGVRQHVALVRTDAGIVKLFAGGTQLGPDKLFTTNLTDNQLSLGYYYSSSFKFDGRISWFRITKGYARYTSSFTPPSIPLPSS